VEVTPFVAPLDDVGVWLSVFDEQGCELQIAAEDGVVHGMADGVWFDGVPVAIDEPLWLQLRIDTDGVAHWEWSGDGTSWNLAHTEACPCDAMAMRSAIFAGDDHNLPTAITRSFESFERCDP
jgi:hypothetical protein